MRDLLHDEERDLSELWTHHDYRPPLNIAQRRRLAEDQFRSKCGLEPDLDDPKLFCEKLTLRKISAPSFHHVLISDKLGAQALTRHRLGDQYVPDVYWVSGRDGMLLEADLPYQFALKTNHDNAGIILFTGGQQSPLRKAAEALVPRLSDCYADLFFEEHYRPVVPKLYVESCLKEDPANGGFTDYKFYCFDGEPHFVQVHLGRGRDHRVAMFDMDWNRIEAMKETDTPAGEVLVPPGFEEMKEVAAKLSAGFSFVRVDLYQSGPDVIMGEMGLTPCAGTNPFYPLSFERQLGEMWEMSDADLGFEPIGRAIPKELTLAP